MTECLSGTVASRPSFLDGERIAATDPPLTYLLQPGNDLLVVAFSAAHPRTKPPQYHTVRTLKDTPYSRLFILNDYGPGEPYSRGCWYLGHQDLRVSDAVGELVR